MDLPGELIGWQAVILHLLLSNLEPNLLQSGLGLNISCHGNLTL